MHCMSSSALDLEEDVPIHLTIDCRNFDCIKDYHPSLSILRTEKHVLATMRWANVLPFILTIVAHVTRYISV